MAATDFLVTRVEIASTERQNMNRSMKWWEHGWEEAIILRVQLIHDRKRDACPLRWDEKVSSRIGLIGGERFSGKHPLSGWEGHTLFLITFQIDIVIDLMNFLSLLSLYVNKCHIHSKGGRCPYTDTPMVCVVFNVFYQFIPNFSSSASTFHHSATGEKACGWINLRRLKLGDVLG